MGATDQVLVVVATVFNILSTIFVVLRMISRMGILRKSSIDDYLIVSAVIFAWFHTGSVYARESDLRFQSRYMLSPMIQKHISEQASTYRMYPFNILVVCFW